jgi:ubiquinone biosynthesis protein UbiJ
VDIKFDFEKIPVFLEKLIQSSQMWHEEVLRKLQWDTVEFLQEEIRCLPALAEVEMFYDEVNQVQREMELLLEKLNNIQTSHT